MLFDTHTHLTDEKFNEDRYTLIKSLETEGICNILEVGYSIEDSIKAVEIAKKADCKSYSCASGLQVGGLQVYAAIGAHPYEAPNMTDADIATLRSLAAHPKVRAIGEIGLDYHADNHTYKDDQKYWFEQQILLAQELNLPIIVHNRDSHADCLSILRKHNVTRGIMHSFSGDADFAKEVLAMGLHISFSGMITYKKSANLTEACKVVPLNKLLIETDCPYLPPEGFRGQRNDPRRVSTIAQKIAEILGMTFDEISHITTENAKQLLNI